jgi:hypothetical protein
MDWAYTIEDTASKPEAVASVKPTSDSVEHTVSRDLCVAQRIHPATIDAGSGTYTTSASRILPTVVLTVDPLLHLVDRA